MTNRIRLVSGTISTDDIIPARYKHMYTDPNSLASHVLESYKPGFIETVKKGDIIANDRIFGIGSSREQAVSALKAAGISAIISPSFGRIFYRNCWNLALPAIEMPIDELNDGLLVDLDLENGKLIVGEGTELQFSPPTHFHMNMLTSGGLLSLLVDK